MQTCLKCKLLLRQSLCWATYAVSKGTEVVIQRQIVKIQPHVSNHLNKLGDDIRKIFDQYLTNFIYSHEHAIYLNVSTVLHDLRSSGDCFQSFRVHTLTIRSPVVFRLTLGFLCVALQKPTCRLRIVRLLGEARSLIQTDEICMSTRLIYVGGIWSCVVHRS